MASKRVTWPDEAEAEAPGRPPEPVIPPRPSHYSPAPAKAEEVVQRDIDPTELGELEALLAVEAELDAALGAELAS